MIEYYIDAKFNNKKFNYNLKDNKLLNKIWEICSDSYGLLIYQESIIKCFSEIAGFNEIESDLSRRVVGKKKHDEMIALKSKFIEGGIGNGYSKEGLEELFNQIEAFANYGFNLSHAVSYSYNTAYCAYLSYYYPLEFFTAILTICSDNTDDVRKAIKAIKERNLTILPPNINKSDDSFIITDNNIIFGLSAIKGVGAAVSRKIIKNRPKAGYKSLGHFVQRNRDIVNSKVLESYAKAGVFSDFGNKESILQSIRAMLDYNSIIKDIDTYTIFDLCKLDYSEFINNCIIRYIDKEDNPSYEIDALGLYINKHPMEDYIVDSDKCIEIKDINNYDDGTPIVAVGALSCIEVKKTKSKLNMANFNLDSSDNTVKCICFTKAYAKVMNYLEEGKLVVISGYIKEDGNEKIVTVNDVIPDLKGYAYEIKRSIIKEFAINERIKFILKKS